MYLLKPLKITFLLKNECTKCYILTDETFKLFCQVQK